MLGVKQAGAGPVLGAYFETAFGLIREKKTAWLGDSKMDNFLGRNLLEFPRAIAVDFPMKKNSTVACDDIFYINRAARFVNKPKVEVIAVFVSAKAKAEGCAEKKDNERWEDVSA